MEIANVVKSFQGVYVTGLLLHERQEECSFLLVYDPAPEAVLVDLDQA